MSFADVGYKFRYMEWAKTVMEADRPGIIDIGSSGVAPLTLRELGVRLGDLALYGRHFYGEPDLVGRVSRANSVTPDRVVTTLGASHALFLVCASLLSPGDEAIVERPGYEALGSVPRALGARVRYLDRRFEDGFQFDPRSLRRLVTPRTRVILLTNLHNPSGVALSAECLNALREYAGDGTTTVKEARRTGGARGGRSSPGALARAPWVVLNEVYRDFVFKDPPPPAHSLGPRGVSLASLTKVYGLGETRVGWAIGDPALVARAWRVNDFGPVNHPYIAERIGALALAKRGRLLARSRRLVECNRDLASRFFARNARLDLVPPAGGPVYFPRVRGVRDTRALAESALARRRVCVVPGAFFGAPGHIRIGVGGSRPARIEEGLRRLTRALADVSGGRA